MEQLRSNLKPSDKTEEYCSKIKIIFFIWAEHHLQVIIHLPIIIVTK